MKSQKVDKKFLLIRGFEVVGMRKLPSWYNIFETKSHIIEVPTYSYKRVRLTIYVYLSPKGPFGEVFCHDHPIRDSIYFHLFFAIRDRDDLASSIDQLVGIVNETIRKERELADKGQL